MNLRGPGALCLGRLLITDDISLIVIGLLRWCISPCEDFGNLDLSRNWLISSVIFLKSMRPVVVAHFSFPILVICVFPLFFLVSSAQRHVSFIDLFQEPVFAFVDFLCWFPVFKYKHFNRMIRA